MKIIAIYHHVGLGDCIDCNAIVRKYCKNYDKVIIFSKNKYLEMIKFMYRDLNNLEIIGVANDNPQERNDVEIYFSKNPDIEKYILGHENYFNNISYFNDKKLSCNEVFYNLSEIPYEEKYSGFNFMRDYFEEERVYKKLNPGNEKYIFVHDDEERGFKINIDTKYKIIKNDKHENIFYMIKILQNAEEIHTMTSSFSCLLDCLSKKINFKKLVLHSSIRGEFAGYYLFSPTSLSKQWIIKKEKND